MVEAEITRYLQEQEDSARFWRSRAVGHERTRRSALTLAEAFRRSQAPHETKRRALRLCEADAEAERRRSVACWIRSFLDA